MASACTIHSAEFRKRFAPDAPADPEIPKGLEQLGDRCALTPCRVVPRGSDRCARRFAWLSRVLRVFRADVAGMFPKTWNIEAR
jgi:hypothetical protein